MWKVWSIANVYPLSSGNWLLFSRRNSREGDGVWNEWHQTPYTMKCAHNKIMIAEITSISVANKKRHSYARKFEIIMMIKLNFLLPLRFLLLSSPFNCAPLNEATLPRSVSVWVGNVYLSGCMHVCVFVCFRGVKRQVLFCSHIYYIEKWNRGSTKDA